MVERQKREQPDFTVDFNEFWAAYPHRVNRGAAFKAYVKARLSTTQALLLEGVARYRRNKPSWAAWANGSSWLNGQRWLDEWGDDKPSTMAPAEDWFDACKRLHNLRCGGQYAHGLRMQIDAQKKESA